MQTAGRAGMHSQIGQPSSMTNPFSQCIEQTGGHSLGRDLGPPVDVVVGAVVSTAVHTPELPAMPPSPWTQVSPSAQWVACCGGKLPLHVSPSPTMVPALVPNSVHSSAVTQLASSP